MPDLWDELSARIVNVQDRVLFDEATNSARAGAMRTSYIAVWLSCAESLKRKFKDAAQTDAAAPKVVGDIADKETKQQAIDAFVLGEAKKYGFVTDAEFTQLENVYAQRCIYGHPYEQAPLVAQLHAAAGIVVEYVLGRPTKLRHGYLSRQVDLICKNTTYLDDHFPAVENCAQIVHQRSSPDIHLWFLQKMWQEFTPSANDPAMAVFFRRVVWFTTAFLRRCDAGFFTAWDAVNDLTRFPFLSHTLATADLFARVSQHAQDIVVGNLLTWAQSQAVAAKSVQDLHDAGVLSLRQVERFNAALQGIPAHVLASAGIHPRYYYNWIIQRLRSYNWYSQSPAIDVLRTLGSSGVAKMDAAQQLVAGNNILQAADGSSNAAASLISEIASGTTFWPEAFVEGVLAECVVNADNRHRFKTTCAGQAMLCIRSVEPAARVGVVNRIVTRLQTSTPKYPALDADDRNAVVAAIDAAMAADAAGCGCLQPLRQAVAGLELQQHAI